MATIFGRIAVTTPILAVALCLAAAAHGADANVTDEFGAAVQAWQGLASHGDADALYNLAQAYKFGKGVPQNMAKAEELFAQAAAKGHVQAADNYGLLLFQRGDGTGALPYILAAAERGDARAQYLLGISSFNGDIVPKDWVRAYALVILAKQAGLPQASSAIAQMDTHIPLEQREQAAALARQMSDRSIAHQPSAPSDEGLSAVSAAIVPPPIPLAPIAKPKPAAKLATQAAVASGRWRVQLGAFSVRANADALWNKLKRRPELSGHSRIDAGSGKVTRLLAGGFASEAEAARACSRLSVSGFSCLVTRN